MKKSIVFRLPLRGPDVLTTAQGTHRKTCSRFGYEADHVGQPRTDSSGRAATCQRMRCRVDQSGAADAQALGLAPQHHRTLIAAAREGPPPLTRPPIEVQCVDEVVHVGGVRCITRRFDAGRLCTSLYKIDESSWNGFFGCFYQSRRSVYEYGRQQQVAWQ